jgi:anhydro-N-acetylmuramic acid kinase
MSLYIGLISGTSMDAVDAVLVSHESFPPKLIESHAHPIPEGLSARLQSVAGDGPPSGPEVWHLDVELGVLFADAAAELLARAHTGVDEVTAIGSHGQTVYHGPNDTPPITVQLGDPNVIAERTGITTVADFRRRDMAAGGQGAPLVPAFHRAVLHKSGRPRVIVNIGGIANVTVLPGDARAEVIGFDTGPGNTLMDLWCRRHRGAPMDRDGRWAKGGKPLQGLLNALLEDPYFGITPPKSTGREYFNLEWLDAAMERASSIGTDAQDVQRTLCELTAKTIVGATRKYAADTREILVCGGGAHNASLMDALASAAGSINVESTAAAGFDPAWVEAIAFSWFAKQTLEGKPSNLPSVTGARHLAILGGIYKA